MKYQAKVNNKFVLAMLVVCRSNSNTISLKLGFVMESVPLVSFANKEIAPNKLEIVNYLKRASATESSWIKAD